MSTLVLVPVATHIPVIIRGCSTCFGVGKVWRAPGVLIDCPQGCTPIKDAFDVLTLRARSVAALLDRAVAMAGGCLECGCQPSVCAGGCNCGCTACCDYPHPLPAATGGAR